MRHSLFVAAVSLLLALAAQPRTAAGASDEEDTPRNPPEPGNDCGGVPFAGTVTELTKDSITIHLAGEKPKRFLVSDVLAAGAVPREPREVPNRRQPYTVMPTFMYRLIDVKVGDHVVIYYAYLGGVSICDHICIQKRPGGLVPPLPEEAEALMNPVSTWKARHPGQPIPDWIRRWPYIPYHEQMKAYWDLEDRGIPYPEKFGKNRRFPVAPMPREVGGGGPKFTP